MRRAPPVPAASSLVVCGALCGEQRGRALHALRAVECIATTVAGSTEPLLDEAFLRERIDERA